MGTDSNTRLHELNNLLTHSLVSSRNGSTTNVGGYRPGMRSSATNLASSGTTSGGHELQTFANGQPPLPSVEALWLRIEAVWEEEYPELEEALNLGASSADLNELEKDLAVGPLPVEVRQFYKTHDGQFRGGKPTGILMGLTLLDMESMMEEYALWAKVAERVEKQQFALQHQQGLLSQGDESSSASQALRERLLNSYLMHQKSVPADAVQSYYVHRGWIPIAKDLYGNMLGLDLAPGPAGVRGQIILYGRDFDTKVVVATSLQELLFQYVTDLEAGNYQIDRTELYEDNGFLDASRDDDYLIGDEDEDNGDLQFFDRDGSEFGKEAQGKITYIEALKRRALRRYGISRVETFQTSFTPQRIPLKRSSPRHSTSSPEPRGSTTNLVNVDSAVAPKETLIDDDLAAVTLEESDKASAKEEVSKKNAEIETPQTETTKEEALEIKVSITKADEAEEPKAEESLAVESLTKEPHADETAETAEEKESEAETGKESEAETAESKDAATSEIAL